MKIRFTTSVAGARFAYDHDEIVDLPPATAREFLNARQAVIVPEDGIEAAVQSAPENAAKRTGRGKRTMRNLGGLLDG